MPYDYQQGPIRIRSITPADTPDILVWRNHPDVRKNFLSDAEITQENHTGWLTSQVDTGRCHQFIIESQGTPVGSVFLKSIEPDHHKAEFGIFLSVAAQGQGIGTQAARLILRHAFDTLGLERVYLCVLAINPGAIRSYEKAGFRQEGVFRKDLWRGDTAIDMVNMAILREEWLEGANQ